MPDGTPGRYHVLEGSEVADPRAEAASRPTRPAPRGAPQRAPSRAPHPLSRDGGEFAPSRPSIPAPSLPPPASHILVVEDDVDQALILTRWLEGAGYQVTSVQTRKDALQCVDDAAFDAVLCDLQLPDGSGLDVARASKALCPQRPCIVATSMGDMGVVVEALRYRVDEFLSKPLTRSALTERLDQLLRPKLATETVLAIGAHPDDVEIGVGGILERHRRAGERIHILTCTGGASGGASSARVKEARHAAQRLRAKLHMGALPDTAVSDGHETIALIEKAIRDCNATTIYTHSLHDMHQDHRAVHRATLVAGRGVPNVFCYQSPSTTTAFQPSHFVDIGATVDAKLKLIGCHQSQAGRAYLEPDLVRSTARYWGRFAGYGMAEPLEVIRSKG